MAATVSASFFSGKGGVGKTTIALNLACALNRLSSSTLLLDCDLGLANVDVFLGLTPEYTLQDLMTRRLNPVDVLVPIMENGTDFIPSAAGLKELVELDEEMRATLLSGLSPLVTAYDSLFLDLGAGITPSVLAFAAMSHLPVVVVTPEPTSLTDGYAMIKVLYATHALRDFHIVVNMALEPEDGNAAFERLAAACEEFLSIRPSLLGVVRYDDAASKALAIQKPLMLAYPESPSARDIETIANRFFELAARTTPLATDSPLRDDPLLSAALLKDTV